MPYEIDKARQSNQNENFFFSFLKNIPRAKIPSQLLESLLVQHIARKNKRKINAVFRVCIYFCKAHIKNKENNTPHQFPK